MVYLDTSFLIDLMKNDSSALSKLEMLKDDILYTTTITLAELYRGAYMSSNKEKEIYKIQNILRFISVTTLDNKSTQKYGELYGRLRSNLLNDADLLIASIVISNNDILLTRDLKHFQKISDLEVDTW